MPATSLPLAIPYADRPAPVELRAVAEGRWSLRVTLDADAKRDLETLTALLGHKNPRGDVSAVLKEALRCAVEKHAVRRGAQAPARTRRPKSETNSEPRSAAKFGGTCDEESHGESVGGDGSKCGAGSGSKGAGNGDGERAGEGDGKGAGSGDRERAGEGDGTGDGKGAGGAISAAVRREVWARDGGRCTFAAPDGTRCGSRWQLELDHVTPRALGGPSTATNLRLRCRVHNILHAELIFGREHMERFRSGGRAASPGSASSAP